MPFLTRNDVLGSDTTTLRQDHIDIKPKAGSKHVEKLAAPTPPVADDYMYDFKYNAPLPTSNSLGVSIPIDCDAQQAAKTLMDQLESVFRNRNATDFANLFLDQGKSFDRFIKLVRCWNTKLRINRRLARQVGLYLGLSHIQLPAEYSSSCQRPLSTHTGSQLCFSQARTSDLPPVSGLRPVAVRRVFRYRTCERLGRHQCRSDE